MSTRTTRVIYDLVARDRASRTFGQVSGAATRLQRTGAGVGAAIAKGFKVGGVAVAGLGFASLKASGDFEKAMNQVSAVSGATGKDFKGLRNEAKQLGRETKFSATQAADGMGFLAMAGFRAKDIMSAMPGVLSLASAGNMDLARSSDIASNILTGYGFKAKDTQKVVDVLAKTFTSTNTNLEQLGEAMKYAGPVAHSAGVKFTEASAAIGLMGNAGIQASLAGTSLRGAISRLLSPTKQISDRLKKLGVTVTDSKGKLLPLADIVEQLGKKGASTGDLMTIFGQRAGPAMAALIDQGAPALRGLTKNLDHAGGTADRIAKTQMKGLQGGLTSLKSAWEGLMIEIGDLGILNLATKGIEGVTTATRGFTGLVDKYGKPAAQGFSRALGSLVPTEKIKTGFSEATSMVSDFIAGLSGGDKSGLKVKIGKPEFAKNTPPSLVNFGLARQKPTAPKSTAPSNLPPSVVAHGLTPQKITPPPSAAKAFGKTIRDSISKGIENLNWGKLGSGIGKGLSSAIGWVGKHASDLTKKMGETLAKIDFVDVGKALGGQALPFAIGVIVNLFEPLFHVSFWKKHWWDTILAILSVIPVGKAAGVLEKLFAKIPFLKAFSPMLKGIEGLGSMVEKGVMRFVVKPLGKFGKSILDGIVTGFTRVFPETAGKLGEFIGKLALNIVGYTGRFAGYGERLIGGLGRGILKTGEGIGKWIGQIIGRLLKPFATVGGWLLGKGRSFVSGLKRGVVDGAKALGSWVWRTAGRPAVEAFASVGSWLIGKGRSFVSGLKNGVVGAARGIGSWAWRTIGRPAVVAFARTGSSLISKGRAFVTGLKSGVVGAMKGIGGWIKKTMIDPIVGAVKHFFGIRSPSRVFMGIGGHLVSGLVKGMAKTSGKAIATKVFGSLPKALAAIAKKGLVSISSLPGKALKALGGLGGDILSFLGLGGGGGGGGSKANQRIGQTLAAAYGWSGPQWAALKNLWNGESGWNEKAYNKSSGATGIPQSLPGSKMASAGSDWRTNPATQIKWGLGYIKSVYGSPIAAYSAWLSRSPHWYAKGTRKVAGGAAKGLAWVGERGAELVNFSGGEDVLSHEDSIAFAKTHGIRLPGYASGTISNAADRVHRDRQRVEDAKDALANAKRRHKGVAAAEKKLKAAEKELQAAELALKNAKRSAKTSISNTIKTGLLKTLETGTSSAIASAIKSLATKLLNAGYNKTAASIQKKGSRLQSLADKRASVQKTIAAANQYATDQAGTIRDFLSISGTSATDVGSLISQMTGQQKTASGFVSLEKSLKARGASKDLLAQLGEAGPGSQLATILGQKSVTTQDIGKLNSLVASGGKLATSFGRDMADLMYDTGKHAGDGFLAGLKATEKDLQNQINKLAKDLVSGIKKALKIKSPSGVFRDEVGKQVALGMVVGMDRHGPNIAAAAHRMATTARKAAASRSFVPIGGGRSAGRDEVWARVAAAMEQQASQPQHLTGQLVLESGELLGVIKGTVQPMIRESEHRTAHRATVGRRTP
ncbi:phage tail tape measure protein [Streptomyces sp. NPDC102394]|uniref:phage tail tape measure protein n=1 Tax=Streptomyces sp. NPDC102394 TaxID=3366167 RepID=UPI00381E99E1